MLIETFLMTELDGGGIMVPSDAGNADGLNYLAGRTLTEVNRKAYEATAAAHRDGGVPNMTVWLNPFDQPGVEAYKQEMFARLGRP